MVAIVVTRCAKVAKKKQLVRFDARVGQSERYALGERRVHQRILSRGAVPR